jgi:hypothetical protein
LSVHNPDWLKVKECKHHWDIESPNGPYAHGVCRCCGAERDFDNSGDLANYDKRSWDGSGRHNKVVYEESPVTPLGAYWS